MNGLMGIWTQRLTVAIGVILTMVIWWPIRDLINGLLGKWAGSGLNYGSDGIIGFGFDAHPAGVISGLVVLFITVALVCAP